MTDHFTLWVCTDCYMVHCNGESENMEPDAPTPWEAFFERGNVGELTAGLLAEEHHEDCDYRNSMAAKETAETFNVDVAENSEVFDCNLDCEHDDFSWQRCGGCGSTLGGTRDAVTFWPAQVNA